MARVELVFTHRVLSILRLTEGVEAMAPQCVARLLIAGVSLSSRLTVPRVMLLGYEGEVFLCPSGPGSLTGDEEVPKPVVCRVASVTHTYAGQKNATEPLIGPSVDGALMTSARQGLGGLLERDEIIEPPGFYALGTEHRRIVSVGGGRV